MMQTSSPSSYSPSTPHHSKKRSLYQKSYTPLNSSPLAQSTHDQTSSPPNSSPISEAQTRRRSQYKSRSLRSSVSPAAGSTGSPVYRMTPDSHGANVSPPSMLRAAYSGGMASQSETHAVLRDKFRFRCMERAERSRRKAVESKRRARDGDDVFMDDGGDDEETDEQLMSDEFYRRIMTNTNLQDRRKALKTFYDHCGSIDPDMEDAGEWEYHLNGFQPSTWSPGSSTEELSPEELERAELEAYAEQCEMQAAFADFEDVPLEELFSLDDVEFFCGCRHGILGRRCLYYYPLPIPHSLRVYFPSLPCCSSSPFSMIFDASPPSRQDGRAVKACDSSL
ncbi:hypothetical protein D9758_010356 [Tetrapyrgos nigripes]|uniref:Uncharacterized protein n=1 Tax=Tetrapyrgos nigripes TaxID=182062 RepID=A0A8H5CZE3_9AGAR|nr:hypothetical protein D9758_010356 [Tetrapyrgos nigripes]